MIAMCKKQSFSASLFVGKETRINILSSRLKVFVECEKKGGNDGNRTQPPHIDKV